jgi:formamidopyrimidine-DNA glycosylase
MPELPDVETFKRYFDTHALRQRIVSIKVLTSRILSGVSQGDLSRALVNRQFKATRRHGKHLFARIDRGPWLALHFGMTGSLHYYRDEAGEPRYTQFRIDFANGRHLAYEDPRKLGRVSITDSPEAYIEAHHLGIDALAIDLKRFRELAAEARGGVKSWLMNQKAIAGIGNIYSDEILFQAGIDPRRSVGDLDDDDIKRLFASLRKSLAESIGAHADPDQMPKSFLIPQRRRNGQCPRGHGPIKKATIGGRTFYYCPKCQS